VTLERGLRELFVWYRVSEPNAARVRAEVEAMQRSLVEGCPTLDARLLIRAEGSGVQTWMETYRLREPSPTNPSGIDDALQARIEAAATPIIAWLEGERHAEAFDRISDA
jgi:hypothetical protein